MRALYRFLSSVRLAAVLLALLAAGPLVSTLLPADAFGKGGFFRSVWFLAPGIAFFANLAVCSVGRFVRELRSGRRRHGPDVLHLGLLALLAGACLSFAARQEGYAALGPGDAIGLPDGSTLGVKSFAMELYPDGRPRDFVTTVDLVRYGKTVLADYRIRVNNPLKLGALGIYQSSHEPAWTLVLEGGPDGPLSLREGENGRSGDASVIFMAMKEASADTALVAVSRPGAATEAVEARAGSSVAGLRVAKLERVELTGLEAVTDPGYFVVLAGFLVTGVGAVLVFAGKLKEAAKP